MPVRIAMFEGLKTGKAKKRCRACSPAAKSWRKRFSAAARKCKPSWKGGRKDFNACMKRALKAK